MVLALIAAIAILFTILILTVLHLCYTLGLFDDVKLKYAEKYNDITVIGKKFTGDYETASKNFERVIQELPQRDKYIGIYLEKDQEEKVYDDANKPYFIGAIFDGQESLAEIKTGFVTFDVRNIEKIIVAESSYRDPNSILIKLKDMYKKISESLFQKMMINSLSSYIEIYDSTARKITLIGVLSENEHVFKIFK